MKTRYLHRLLCLILALLFVLPMVSGCNNQSPPPDNTTENPSGNGDPENEVPENYVGFEDIDFSDLANFKEAADADSGENGDIYVVHQNVFKNATKNAALNYDMMKFSVSLQGLLNRDEPVLYVDDGNSMNWFRFLRATTDGLLYGKKQKSIESIDALLSTFDTQIKDRGIVVWDPTAPYTSNIATTVCGVEGYLPVMYSEDSAALYQILLARFGEDVVKMDLRGKFTGEKGTKIWDTDVSSSGSAKCDSYLWALEKYLKEGLCDRGHIAYMTDFYPLSEQSGGKGYLDNSPYETYLPSQDYIVANAIFVFDLSIFSDEPATDDSTQPTGLDYQTLKKILQCQYDLNDGAFSKCIGFPPFPYKYTVNYGGKYDDVMAEWTTVEVMSCYNIAVEADCPGPSSLYNTSVYSQYEQQLDYSQSDKRQNALDNLPEYDENTYYVYIYGGDYDAASWLYHIAANGTWQSEDRGKIPLSWAFNPNLMERVPMLWDVFYATATENDFFIAGDSGAGYINPMLLRQYGRKHSGLPSGVDAWVEWCEYWYERADLSITGMLLDGNNPYANDEILKAYLSFSYDGIGVWNWPGNDSGIKEIGGTGISGMAQDWGFTRYNTPEEAAQSIVKAISSGRKLNFYPLKTNIIDPTLACEALELAQQMLDEEGRGRVIQVVDPYTFFAMLARELDQ